MRALRATLIVPGLFALTYRVIGDLQMAIFAVFGGFATLVMASFGGSRKDRAVAHLGLAVVGSAALTIGTLVSGTAWLAAVVTIPVAFAIFFAGVAGPNAASGVTAALLAYVLPVASAGTAAAIPARLAGWWLASAVSTAAVLLLSPRQPSDRLVAAAAKSARALATHLRAAVRGEATLDQRDGSVAAKHELMTVFASASYRPTGLATADQALGSLIQLLEWCTSLICDAMDGHLDLSLAAPADRELLDAAAGALSCVAGLLTGEDTAPDIQRIERARAASAAHQRGLSGDTERLRRYSTHAFHAQVIAITSQAVAADAMIATRRADPQTIAAERSRWYGGQPAWTPSQPAGQARGKLAALAAAGGMVARHASLRSVWFRNSARGAAALAVAVAVADLSGVQHGFWVVLGTLSVLRTNAASTGSTAMRALAGTVAGFAVGAALLLAIGTEPAALWVALPIAVLVASYAPGTAPFVVGQAAFTVTVVVLFNLLAPAGWKVGLLRIEDVAIGCGVSLLVGILFWPRGASAVVGDDLADAFQHGASYLRQAVDWSLGVRAVPPDEAIPAIAAGIRLDDALRGFLTEQGAKRVSKQDLWSLVMATMRVRLTAFSMAGLHLMGGDGEHGHASGAGDHSAGDGEHGHASGAGDHSVGDHSAGDHSAGDHSAGDRGADDHGRLGQVRSSLRQMTTELASFYDLIAIQVGPPNRMDVVPVPVPPLEGYDGATPAHYHPHILWVREHLQHLAAHAQAITAPAARVARQRRLPWWR
jgi:uncharacterized membrane protein YccC